MTYSLKLVGATDSETVRDVVALAVISASCPAPGPRIIATRAPCHILVAQFLLLSLMTAVVPGTADEHIPRSPLIHNLVPVVAAALSSTAYSARSIVKKRSLRSVGFCDTLK